MEQVNETETEIDRNVTIQALRKTTRNLLSALLNPDNMIRTTNENLPRNWIGLAELCNIKGEYYAILENNVDPTDRVLELWHEQDVDHSTIDTLLLHLTKLKRRAVISRIITLIDADIEYYRKAPFKSKPLKVHDESNILTNDDVIRYGQGLGPQLYDAFVLFAEDDIAFATELIDTMEKQYHMKFCVKDRNLISRGIEISVVIKLITERCKRVIIILSDAFFKSTANNYFLQFTQSYQILNRDTKIIPCVYKTITEMPNELKGHFMLDYERSKRFGNFWELLNRQLGNAALTRSRSETNNATCKHLEIREETSLLKPQSHHVQFNSTEALYTPPVEKPTLSNGNESTCDNTKPVKSKNKLSNPLNWLNKLTKPLRTSNAYKRRTKLTS